MGLVRQTVQTVTVAILCSLLTSGVVFPPAFLQIGSLKNQRFEWLGDFLRSLKVVAANIVAVIAELFFSADPKATSAFVHGKAFTSGYWNVKSESTARH